MGLLRRCLEALAAHTVRPAWTLVVDNGSNEPMPAGFAGEFPAVEFPALADLDLALAVASARKERQLSQRELAKRAGLTQAMIARLEKRENLSATIRTLAAVAVALGCRLRIEFEPDRVQRKNARRETRKLAA